MTREQIKEAIEEICETLAGHGLNQAERLMLHADRKELQEKLAAMEATASEGAV